MNNKHSFIINIIITTYNSNFNVTENNNYDNDIHSPIHDDLTGLTIQLIAIEKLITTTIQLIKNNIL